MSDKLVNTKNLNDLAKKLDKRNNDNIALISEKINEINTELETKASTEFVNNMLGGLKLVQMTQAEYDALQEKRF